MSLLRSLAKRLLAEPELPPELGRNEPCWCGSGKKYKNCHLERDERRRSAVRATVGRRPPEGMF